MSEPTADQIAAAKLASRRGVELPGASAKRLEVHEPESFTLEGWRKLRAEGDKEDDRKAKAK